MIAGAHSFAGTAAAPAAREGRLARLARRSLSGLRRFARGQTGSSTVEFVVTVPIVLALMFSAIDFGVVMLRQAYLDRAVDISVRDVRLGRVSVASFEGFRDAICARTLLVANCQSSITIEMRPVDVNTWGGLDAAASCIDRAEDFTPMLEFQPGAGDQELMLIKVCLVTEPFMRITGYVYGMTLDPSGAYAVVARAAWTNEPR